MNENKQIISIVSTTEVKMDWLENSNGWQVAIDTKYRLLEKGSETWIEEAFKSAVFDSDLATAYIKALDEVSSKIQKSAPISSQENKVTGVPLIL